MMSIAVPVSAVRIWACVKAGPADLTRAATPAALGAAAEVPKNGLPNPPTPVTDTPSAAVISGLFSTVPPVELKFPGVIAVEFPLKKIRRRPSELNVSTWFAALNGLGNGPEGPPNGVAAAGVAATEYAPTADAEECPWVSPEVASVRVPRKLLMCKNRSNAPVF